MKEIKYCIIFIRFIAIFILFTAIRDEGFLNFPVKIINNYKN